MLRLQRRFVFELDPVVLRSVRDVINENTDLSLAVVAHSGPLSDESFEESLAASQEQAQEVKQMLTDMGADTRNLTAFGAGAVAPVSGSSSIRFELVKLN